MSEKTTIQAHVMALFPSNIPWILVSKKYKIFKTLIMTKRQRSLGLNTVLEEKTMYIINTHKLTLFLYFRNKCS
jgi:hypothetical protein